ncbi:MAG: hypothetical protein IT177_05585 [Acidobacteria bacterium]|nr:hypothetical protein [Acidobacteriota bacterium]
MEWSVRVVAPGPGTAPAPALEQLDDARSVGAVKANVFHALGKLRKILGSEP